MISTEEFAASGVMTYQLAVIGQLATEVSKVTRRGTDVDLFVHKGRRIGSAAEAIRRSELEKYNAFVVALGATDAFTLTPLERWSRGMESLLTQLQDRSVPGTPIVVAGIPSVATVEHPISAVTQRAHHHAARLNQATERLCARLKNATFASIPQVSSARVRSAASIHSANARIIAQRLVPKLEPIETSVENGAQNARSVKPQPQSQSVRDRAMRDLGLPLTSTNAELDRVVDFARTYFRAQHAALVLLNGDKLVFNSKAGFRGKPDLLNLVLPTFETGRPVSIGNMHSVGSRSLSFHVGGAEMGFFAGYPIETPGGYRAAVLCVFDPIPRQTRASNTVLLRDLAMLLQRELWAAARIVGSHG